MHSRRIVHAHIYLRVAFVHHLIDANNRKQDCGGVFVDQLDRTFHSSRDHGKVYTRF